MHEYMSFANYNNLKVDSLYELGLTDVKTQTKLYVPVFDIFGPYFFYPPHCHPRHSEDAEKQLYHSPIIGVFKNDNQVQEDIVNTLESLFRGQ